MMDAETFKRTAPKWNCVDYPGEGMHYLPVAGATCCAWCGATRAEIAEQHSRVLARLQAARPINGRS